MRTLERADPLAWPTTVAAVVLGLFSVWVPVAETYMWPGGSRWVYGAGLLIGLAGLVGARRRGSAVAVLALVFWGVWLAAMPLWTAWAPNDKVHQRIVSGVITCALLGGAVSLLGRGRRSTVQACRVAWVSALVGLVPMGAAEVITHRHFDPSGIWIAPPGSPAGPFGNPNNFAVVLVLGAAVCLLWATERMPVLLRIALVGLAAAAGALVVATLSRAAEVSLLLVVLAAAHLEWRRRGGHTRARAWMRDHRRLSAIGACLVAGLAVASVTVPALARHNPVLRTLRPGDAATEHADRLRADLLDAGVQLWLTSPWTGVGGNHAVFLVRKVPAIRRYIPLHNGFLQILTEYGVLVATPLAALLVVLVARTLPRRRSMVRSDALERGRPTGLDEVGARYLLAACLGGFALAGVLTSSPVVWPVWWYMLGSATATAWWIGALRTSSRPRDPEPAQADANGLDPRVLDALTRQSDAATGIIDTHVPRHSTPRPEGVRR